MIDRIRPGGACAPSPRQLLLASVGLLALFAAPALAAPDVCAPDGPGSVVCSGDQSDGIADGPDFDPALVELLTIRALTADIAPAAGIAGVVFRQQDGDLRIVTEGGDYAIVTEGGASGILAELETELFFPAVTGALLRIENGLDIVSAGTGIFAGSLAQDDFDFEWSSDQSETASQTLSADADDGNPDVTVVDNDLGDQGANAFQNAFLSLPTASGAIEIENSATIVADGDGIVALSELSAETELATSAEQVNVADQRAEATASSSSNTAVSASIEAVQDYYQEPYLEQEIALTDGTGAARVAVANSGTVVAGGDGIVAGSAVFLQRDTALVLEQVTIAEQTGAALAMTDDGDASALAEIQQSQVLTQGSRGIQEIGDTAWEEAGAVTVDNSGLIVADGHGIVASAQLLAMETTVQAGLQGTLSFQEAGAAAEADEGEATAEIGAVQDLIRLSEIRQSSVSGGLAGAASLSVINSGEIASGGHGILAEANLATLSIGLQELAQESLGMQGGAAVAEEFDGEAAGGAEVSQRNLQISAGIQDIAGRDGAGVGAVTVDNSGTIFADGDGIRAGSTRLALSAAAQFGHQHSDGIQQGLVVAEGPDAAALDLSRDEDTVIVAEQSQERGTGARAGAVTVTNSGTVVAGGDGIAAATQVILQGIISQELEQGGEVLQDTLSLGSGRLDQQQHEETSHRAEQTAEVVYGNRTGAVAIDNIGLISAGGDGLVARSQVAAGALVYQDIFQSSVAAQLADGISDGTQIQELQRSSRSEQHALVRLGQRVGAVSVDNSGVVIAEGDGIVAQAEVDVALFAEQFVFQHNEAEQSLLDSAGTVQRQNGSQSNLASQRIQLQLRDGVGAVEVDNSGVVIAEGDGLVATSTIALALEVDSDLDQTISIGNTVDNLPGSEQSRNLAMENQAEQQVEVTMAASAGAVTVRNSGLIVAEGDGIVAGSELFLDGDLPAGLRAGEVDLRSDGVVVADGTGIRAFSFVDTEDGIGPGGDITVRIGKDGVVMGGSGYAVDIEGGDDNRLVNRGVLVSASNRAVRGGDGDERIVNYGTIVGNVDLGGGANSFANRSGALFETGRRVNLGAGGQLTNAGTLSPGGEGQIRRTAVQGDLRQSDGSVYLVDIDADGRSDRLAVTGGVTIETGSTVQVQRATGNYDAGSRYRILTATQGIQGEFDELEQGLPFMELQLGYQTHYVYLDVGRSGTAFADVARSSNQRGVAQALGSLGSNNALYQAIVWLTEEEAVAAYDNLSGELHATTQSFSGELARRLRTTLLNRIGGAGTGFGGGLQSGNLASLVLAASDADPEPTTRPERRGPERQGPQFWMQAYGGTGSQDGDGNAAATTNAAWGSVLGAEFLLSDRFGIGLAAGYQNDRLEVDARQSRAEIDSYSLAAYGLWRQGPWRLRGGAGFSWHEFDSRRDVAVGGVTGTAKARYSGWSGQAFGEVGYRIDLEAISLEPFAGLTFQHTRTESYRESGAGAANLDVRSDRGSELTSTLGVQVMRSFELESGLRLRPHASVAWEHRLAGAGAQADIGFVAGGSRFRVSGPTRNRNAAQLGAGLDIELGSGFEAFGNYDVHLSRSHRDHTARAGVRLRF